MSSPFLIHPATPLSITTTVAAASGPLLLKPSHTPAIKKPNRRHKISCKSNDQEPSSPPNNEFDRRNVLIGLGGLYGATSLATSPFSFADPISPPDVSKCHRPPTDLPNHAPPDTDCCPPTTDHIIDFKFPPPLKTMRVRPAAHLADKAYIDKFNRAMKIMRSLPDSDPRSFSQQSKIHCAYCNGGYDQADFPKVELQVHNSWLFFPFHRCYLYFFERILGKLIDDPTFAMPFWNWDSPGGMTIPSMYADPSSALFDSLRNRTHQPPVVIDLNYSKPTENITPEEQIKKNLSTMYTNMVTNASAPTYFFGGAYRSGDDQPPGMGSIESVPHVPVHIWTGDPTQPEGEDMGNFYSAGRDPIFFAHHSNVDRLWSVWKTLDGVLTPGEKNQDLKDPDFLEAAFLFYDENGQMVKIKVSDCLDTTKLGYVYQDVENPWLDSKPKPKVSAAFRKLKKLGKANIAETTPLYPSPKEVLPTKLDKVLKVMVKRPTKKDNGLQEILVIQGIELERDVYAKFDIYINDEDDGVVTTENNTEFAGSFANAPHKHKHGNKIIKTQFRLPVTGVLKDLGAEDDEYLLVTLVPTNGGDAIKIDGIKIEFDG